jgi:hypothetical protein
MQSWSQSHHAVPMAQEDGGREEEILSIGVGLPKLL